ncbi:hypothetical protein BDZ89DRAFT_1165120 [Hymenopellis radicata]|nr:hypothetical protein BDZ89DRAFT_1165120 [Hymenopellis radicata]
MSSTRSSNFSFAPTAGPPIAFSRVCSRWRAIALNDSTLWNQIFINEDSIDRRLSARDIHRAQGPWSRHHQAQGVQGAQVPASSPLHIFIDLNARDLSPSWEFHQTKSLAALLTPYVYSIHTLYIETSGMWKHCAILLKVLRGCVLPNLTDLKVDRSEQTAPVPRSRPSFFPGTPDELLCPNLWRVNLTGTYHDWDRFGARNLACLMISKLPLLSRPTVIQLRGVLEMSSATLETLDLTGALPFLEPDDGMVLPPLPLTRLTRLRLGYVMPLELDAFASNFLMPALTHLSISNLDPRAPADLGFAEESEIYGDTLNSFTVLLASIPFHQLEAFTLRGAQFGSPAPYIATEEMAASGSVSLSSLPVPFQLLQCSKNARKVRLDNPDRFLLMGMLYPQLDMLPKDRKEDDDVLDFPIVLANVKELSFKVDTDDQAHRSIMRYLGDRRERHLVRGENGMETYVGEQIDVLRLNFPLLPLEKEATVD